MSRSVLFVTLVSVLAAAPALATTSPDDARSPSPRPAAGHTVLSAPDGAVAVQGEAKRRRYGGKRIRRRFPVGWCPIENSLSNPVVVEFRPSGSTATITFTADNFDSSGVWNNQRLDSVVVVESREYFAHLRTSACYLDDDGFEAGAGRHPGSPYLDFASVDPDGVAFADFFIGGPDPRWTGVGTSADQFGNGASKPVYWVSDDSSFQPDLVTIALTNGSLGLGRDLAGENEATTSLTLDNLRPGVDYVVTAWWFMDNGAFDGDPGDEQRVGLTVDVSAPEPAGGCVSSDDVLCLNDDRFQVEVLWRDFRGLSGRGRVSDAGTADSGLFWFFRDTNWELLVKVLNGCAVNGHYWVFAAATTNVGYDLVVTDTVTREQRVYSNPLGVRSPAVTDSSAFATCSP